MNIYRNVNKNIKILHCMKPWHLGYGDVNM